jgi:hypothetical protein
MIQDSILVCSPDLRIPHTVIHHRQWMLSQQKAGQWSHQVNGRDIRVHSVGGKCFFMAVDIQCGEWRFEMLLENRTHWHPGILGGIFEGVSNNILRKPGKVGAKLSKKSC